MTMATNNNDAGLDGIRLLGKVSGALDGLFSSIIPARCLHLIVFGINLEPRGEPLGINLLKSQVKDKSCGGKLLQSGKALSLLPMTSNASHLKGGENLIFLRQVSVIARQASSKLQINESSFIVATASLIITSTP